jgi:ATP-dependent RNA helicase RhlE
LSEKLVKSGITSAAIHGNKSQAARTKALDGFKKGVVKVLVATDIAARGLDIPLLPHVINYELPNVAEDYVHRIGRTGRAGAKGEAISLVGSDEKDMVNGIEKLIGERILSEAIEGYEPSNRPDTRTEDQKKSHYRKPKSTGGKRDFKRKLRRSNN